MFVMLIDHHELSKREIAVFAQFDVTSQRVRFDDLALHLFDGDRDL